MTDFTTIQAKIDALKAKVEQNSISPITLGVILEDLLEFINGKMEEISELSGDVSDLSKKINATDKTLEGLTASISKYDKKHTPVQCSSEEDLASKAASSDYQIGQQFYIAETD